MSTEAEPLATKPRRRLRVSLRTLLLLTLTAGCAFTAWFHRNAWVEEAKLPRVSHLSPNWRYAVDTERAFTEMNVQVVDLRDGSSFSIPAPGYVSAWSFSNDERRALSLPSDQSVLNVWDLETHALLRSLDHFPIDRGNRITTAEFSPDGKCVLLIEHDEAYEWDIDTGELRNCVPWSNGWVSGAHFYGNGSVICWYGGTRRLIHFTDRKTQEEIRTLSTDFDVSTVSLSSDEKRMMARGYGPHEFKCWDLVSGRSHILQLPQHASTPCFSRDMRFYLYSTGRALGDGEGPPCVLKIHETLTDDLVTTIPKSYKDTSVAFTPDNQRVLATNGGRVYVWSAVTGQQLAKFGDKSKAAAIANPFSNPDSVYVKELKMTPDGESVYVPDSNTIYRRRRPERSWNIAVVLLIAFCVAVIVSMWKDWRGFARMRKV
jgi:WD40 repeat protein